MPRCEIALDGSPVISSPSNRTPPLVGRSTPVRQLKNVLLPAPLGPMIARISLRATSKLTSDSALRPPKRTERASVRRMGAEAAPRLSGERMSADGSALTLCGERTSRRHDGLVAGHGLFEVISPAADFKDEL